MQCAPGQTPVYANLSVIGYGDLGTPAQTCLGHKTVLTAAAVANAFRRIGVPTPALHIQPVKGRTLVNFRTNFYATGGAAYTRTLTLLGQRVQLRISVEEYDFRFGDGADLVSAQPGGKYPRLVNTHEYLRKGVVHPSLSTTWQARYRVGGGAWQDVVGTVTATGPPQRLEVTTATPVLVDPYDHAY
ncbi:hypothetical protein [Nocardioides montaniterrae]